MLCSWIDLLLGTLMLSSVLAKMEVYLTQVECLNYAPEIIKNASCHINRTSQKPGLLNVELVLTEDVGYAHGPFILSIKQGSYLRNVTTMELDYCQLLSSLHSQIYLRAAVTEFRRTGNFPLECPLKKNKRYYVNGFAIGAKLLPSYIPEVNFISDFHINLKDRKGFRIITKGRIGRGQ